MTISTLDLIRNVNTDGMDEFSKALHSLILGMMDDGYKCRAPSREVEEGDAKVVAKLECKRCKGEFFFQPFYREQDQSYRAFAVCKACGKVGEF